MENWKKFFKKKARKTNLWKDFLYKFLNGTLIGSLKFSKFWVQHNCSRSYHPYLKLFWSFSLKFFLNDLNAIFKNIFRFLFLFNIILNHKNIWTKLELLFHTETWFSYISMLIHDSPQQNKIEQKREEKNMKWVFLREPSAESSIKFFQKLRYKFFV